MTEVAAEYEPRRASQADGEVGEIAVEFVVLDRDSGGGLVDLDVVVAARDLAVAQHGARALVQVKTVKGHHLLFRVGGAVLEFEAVDDNVIILNQDSGAASVSGSINNRGALAVRRGRRRLFARAGESQLEPRPE